MDSTLLYGDDSEFSYGDDSALVSEDNSTLLSGDESGLLSPDDSELSYGDDSGLVPGDDSTLSAEDCFVSVIYEYSPFTTHSFSSQHFGLRVSDVCWDLIRLWGLVPNIGPVLRGCSGCTRSDDVEHEFGPMHDMRR